MATSPARPPLPRALAGIGIAIEQARRARDAAAQALVRLQGAEQGARHQLDQLETYARETTERWAQQARIRATPEMMQHHYQFMARLDHATDIQRGVVHQQGLQLAQGREVLLAAELRLTSLQKMVDRRLLDAERLQHRREQKDNDEMAARQFRRQVAAAQDGAHDTPDPERF
jgi:flagellar FliJ protein